MDAMKRFSEKPSKSHLNEQPRQTISKLMSHFACCGHVEGLGSPTGAMLDTVIDEVLENECILSLCTLRAEVKAGLGLGKMQEPGFLREPAVFRKGVEHCKTACV